MPRTEDSKFALLSLWPGLLLPCTEDTDVPRHGGGFADLFVPVARRWVCIITFNEKMKLSLDVRGSLHEWEAKPICKC